MKAYQQDLQAILDKGKVRDDRTGTGTIGIFGTQTRYDLSESFPAMTTKKLAWKAVVSELLWFLEGSGDERRLAEILHGTRDLNKETIWTDNAQASYWKPKAKFDGDLGSVYGVQWRSWKTFKPYKTEGDDGMVLGQVSEVDQVANLIHDLKNDPYSRRHILSAWDPGELGNMALPPCHLLAQFYVSDGKLSCQMYQRSADMFLGVPFNIASYSLLTHMIAHVCDLEVGEFVHTIGDAHIYLNHTDAVKTQLAREPLALPKLWINPEVKNIFDFTMDDVKLIDYESHASIAAKMAV